MQRQICDICDMRDATQSYQVRKSTRRIEKRVPIRFRYGRWSEWKNIDICDSCAEKLFNVKEKIDDNKTEN